MTFKSEKKRSKIGRQGVILAAFPVGGGPVVSWVLVPIALVAGVIFGVILSALVMAEQDDDR